MSTTSTSDNSEAEPKGKNGKSISYWQLLRFATPREKALMFVAVLLGVAEGAMFISIWVIQGLVANLYITTGNGFGKTEFLHSCFKYCAWYLGCGILMVLFTFIEAVIFNLASDRMIRRIRSAYVEAVLLKDVDYLDATSPGTISSQLNTAIDRIRDGIGDKLSLYVRTIGIAVAALVIMFVKHWKLALIMSATIPMAGIVMAILPFCTKGISRKYQETIDDANGLSEECILNVKTVMSCNGQQSMIDRFQDVLDKSRKIGIKLGIVTGVFEGLFNCILYAVLLNGVRYGVNEYHTDPTMNVSSLFTVCNIGTLLAYSLGMLAPHSSAVTKARIAATSVYDVIDSVSPEDQKADGDDPSEVKCDIVFNNVHFKYPTRETPILKGLSWSVTEGESIALVGHSGGGKSTSIGLISRLYSCTKGTITIGGIDINKFNIPKLRKMIGIVSQEPTLFNGSIRDNIKLGREGVDDETVEKCATIANAHDFIVQLKDGYDTILGAGGVSLSGGQKQRIAIARAIATNPRILLLDEATSALDTQSERTVQKALEEASKGRTTIIVAHRLSTINHVNRIFVIHNGRVIEDGSYDGLVAQNGRFAKMVNLQQIENFGADEEPTGEHSKDDLLERASVKSSRSSRSTTSTKTSLASTVPCTQATNSEDSLMGRRGISRLLRVSPWRYALVVFITTIKSFEVPVFIVTQYYTFKALEEKDFQPMLNVAIFGSVALGIFGIVMFMLCRSLSAWISGVIMGRVRIRCLSSLLHRPCSYFDNAATSPAACSVILSQDAMNVASVVDYRACLVIENFLSVVGIIGLAAYFCWPNGIAAFVGGVLFTLFFLFFTWRTTRLSQLLKKADTSSLLAIEIFENTKTIQLLSSEQYFHDRFMSFQDAGKKYKTRLSLCMSAVYCLSQSFVVFTICAATFFGGIASFHGFTTFSELYASEVSVVYMGFGIIYMSTSFNDLITAKFSAKRLFSLIEDEQKDIREGLQPEIEGSVEVEDVSFSYPSRPDFRASDKLSLSISPGEAVALVGPSGSGKSTLIQLLERFYDPTKGTILIDGVPIEQMSLHHLRSHIAFVGQEPVLFRGTIYENIALGVEDATIEMVRAACRTAFANEFIESFPEGYDTEVGSRGTSLSGGQKQRIAIARAIVRNPQIILLDEATSALDSQSEQVVNSALEATSVGRTSITVAHRLASIRFVNRIFVIEHGKIVESGTHEQLMRLGRVYAALAKEQLM